MYSNSRQVHWWIDLIPLCCVVVKVVWMGNGNLSSYLKYLLASHDIPHFRDQRLSSLGSVAGSFGCEKFSSTKSRRNYVGLTTQVDAQATA